MITFERNERDFVRHLVRNMVQNPRVGRVVQVYEHVSDGDNSNFEADVIFPAEADVEHRVSPIQGPHSDSIAVPRVGDKVVVEYLNGDKKNPLIRGIVDTNQDRAVKGEAGMWRKKLLSDTSPVGDGDLYVTTHTRYNKNPALNDYRDLTPEQSFVRVAKKADAMDEPSDEPPMYMELFDDPLNGESRIRLQGNQVDGDSSQSMDVDLDFKAGTMRFEAENSTGVFGVEVDVKNGTFTIIDQNGYGIESDGSGNFTWHHESIDMSEGTTTSL